MFEQTEGFYRVLLVEEPHPSGVSRWLAIHPDLPGCNAAADDQTAALVGLEKSREAWLATATEHGHPVPPPLSDPLIQIMYAVNPLAFFDGQRGSETLLQTVQSQPQAA